MKIQVNQQDWSEWDELNDQVDTISALECLAEEEMVLIDELYFCAEEQGFV